MKENNVIIKIVAVFMMALVVTIYPSGYVYASREEVLDLEEEKSDIEDKIEERRAQGKSYEDLEEHRNDVQDEIDNVREEG
ncbi:MAG: hypothetical protein ACI4QQ_03305 [Phascolarctobacterium sp.]